MDSKLEVKKYFKKYFKEQYFNKHDSEFKSLVRLINKAKKENMSVSQLQSLMDDISQWSDATFGDGQRNPAILYHLKKEVDELIEALTELAESGCDDSVGIGQFGRHIEKTQMEYADCFMLLLDSAHHFGLTAEKLIKLTREKLEINKQRKWGKPDANGVVEHI